MSGSLAGADLLSVADFTAATLNSVLDVAASAKGGVPLGTPLAGKHFALIFQRPSNRTRVSFEVAIHRLGGAATALFNPEIHLGERETASDISRILSRYVDGVVARLVSHRDLVEIAAASDVPVINAMTDREHPCQILADLFTVRELCGSLDNVKVTYIGDGNNVCNSWILAAAILGLELSVVCPVGYEPGAEVLAKASQLRANHRVVVTHEAQPVLANTDIIYTDVWTSMGQEAEQQRRREDFAHLQVNEDLLSWAPKSAKVLHCLPAHRGEEITDAVIDGPQSAVFDQAENRLWAQMAVLSLIFAS